MSLERLVISDQNPNRSPPAPKLRSGEIDVDHEIPTHGVDANMFVSPEQALKKWNEDGNKTDEDSDGSEEGFKHCEVCMKDEEHWSYDCPYLECIPNPKDTPVGEGYIIVCTHFSQLKHGHPDGSWEGRATRNPYDSSLIFRKPGVIYHKPDANDEDDVLD